jgi:tRNA nucleotidyltransferase (CCA-adding enzyme)
MRYAARLGYTFAPETQKLARHALHKRTFFKLTPERRRNELIRILEELAPERVFDFPLGREYDLIKQFHPLLVWNKQTLLDFQKIKEEYRGFALDIPATQPRQYKLPAYLFALCREATSMQIEQMARDLRFSDAMAIIPAQVARLRAEVLPQLAEGLPNSQLYTLLHPYDKQALEIAALFAPEKAAILAYYTNNVPRTAPQLGGDYLKELGLKPGKHFKVILDELRAAVLDGKLLSREDEENFLKEKAKQLLP